MDANAYVGEVIAGFVYFFVGVRLYLLSRRTGQLPEALIAASFLLWVVAYAFYDISFAFVESEELIPAVCSYGSLIALALGNVVFTLFIRTVFRPDARWALWLVVAVAVSNLVGVVGMGSRATGRAPIRSPIPGTGSSASEVSWRAPGWGSKGSPSISRCAGN